MPLRIFHNGYALRLQGRNCPALSWFSLVCLRECEGKPRSHVSVEVLRRLNLEFAFVCPRSTQEDSSIQRPGHIVTKTVSPARHRCKHAGPGVCRAAVLVISKAAFAFECRGMDVESCSLWQFEFWLRLGFAMPLPLCIPYSSRSGSSFEQNLQPRRADSLGAALSGFC